MRPLILPILAAALVLSGCSGATSQEGSDDAATDATAERVKPTTDTETDTDSDSDSDSGQQAASDGDAASAIPDACEMLSADEITAITASAGFDLSFDEVPSSEHSDGSSSTCMWQANTFSSVAVALIDLGVDASEIVSHAGVTTQAADLDLPGADAAWQSADGTTVQMAAGTRACTVIMMAMNDSGADTADATAAIAKKVAANL
jgi:hypothetical protein